MDEPARRVLHRYILSTASLFSSIKASLVFIILLRTKTPKYLLNNLCATQTANTEKIWYQNQCTRSDSKHLHLTNINLRIQGVNAAILKATCKVVVKPIWIVVRTQVSPSR